MVVRWISEVPPARVWPHAVWYGCSISPRMILSSGTRLPALRPFRRAKSEVMMSERFGPIGNERYRQYLKDIHTSGGHLISLLNDLVDREYGRIYPQA